jgi:hypothetical protein
MQTIGDPADSISSLAPRAAVEYPTVVDDRIRFALKKDFLRLNASGVLHAGIVYCRQGKRGIDTIIQNLAEVWEIMETEEMQDWFVEL